MRQTIHPWRIVTHLSLLLAMAAGCRSNAGRPSATGRDIGDTLRKMVADTLAKYRTGTVVASPLAALIDSLPKITGSFSQSAGRWVFSGDISVFVAIADHGDSAVLALVECLDQTRPSRVTVDGRSVALGVICLTALQRMAYATQEEDTGNVWPGNVDPTAGASELKAAKRAWVEVVREKRYRLA